MLNDSSRVGDRLRAEKGAARAAGFSLVELMVAVALSLLLLGGVVAMFSSSRVSYESTDQLSRLQETGRLALDDISRHIRSAGFSGCSRQPIYTSTSLNGANLLQFNFLEGPVRGYQASDEGVWLPALDTSVAGAVSGSDVLVLRGPRLGAEPLQLTVDMTTAEADLMLPKVNTGVQALDVVMAYSCEAQSFFYATSFNSSSGVLQHAASGTTPGNSNAAVGFQFRNNAEVVPVETVVYYVRLSEQAGSSLPPLTPSLWRRVGMNVPEELVQGVEQMQLEFGVDTAGNDRIVDEYRTADAVTDWQRVVSVSVALLVRSVEQYGTDTDRRTYDLLGTPFVGPGDRRLREVFTATASLRNRVFVD